MRYVWACLECGKTFKSAKAAERAMFSDSGCPGCGGSDIDNVTEDEAKRLKGGSNKPSYDSEMHQGGAAYNDVMFG